MKSTCLILSLVVAVCAASVLLDRSLDSHWELYKKTHGKTYESTQEELKRRMIWEHHLDYIEKHNEEAKLGKHSFFLRMNKFGDLTNAEFRSIYNGFNRTKTMEKAPSRKVFQMPNTQIPDSVDWRKQGYVTSVKDQGQCGSCWAFSAIASLEGQHFKSAGQLVSLSEQNLVDCSRPFGNMGCDGGLMDQAFAYIEANRGVDTEKSYPYEAYDQKCKFKPTTVGATMSNFVDIRAGSEDDLTAALATIGPISVAIDASQDSFQFYSSGIYYEPMCSSTDLDHGVTAVGYGEEGNKHKEYFYIVKNSWGEGWGDGGYIKMARNNKNMCGIATQASYPEI